VDAGAWTPVAERSLRAIHDRLLAALGPQGWWPADTAEEVVIGAVLTQAVSWRNVERAIAALRSRGLLTLRAVAAAPPAQLAHLIRPAGYFNAKARKLKAVAEAVLALGGVAGLAALPLAQARRRLLGVYGIGPETADAILNYAAGHPTFVADAYARRVLGRVGAVDDDTYEGVRAEVLAGMPGELLGEFHALLVAVGKDLCRPRAPRCGACPLRELCAHARSGEP
jgi:endonuclease-3 related protein